MTRTRTGVAAAFALAAGLATACSSTEQASSVSSPSAVESASSTAGASTSQAVTSTATIPTSDEPAGIVDAIATAGGECGPVAERTERTCTLNGISFTLAEFGWEAQAAARKRACDEGYISTEYHLLSDGRWTIAADYDEDYAAIRTALTGQRINAELRPYC